MEFLDTRNTSEEERNEIIRILAASNSVELPFGNIGSGGGIIVGDDSILVSSSSSSSTIITNNTSSITTNSSSSSIPSSIINNHHHLNHNHHHHNNNTLITTNAAVNNNDNNNNNNTNQDQVGIDVFTSITSPVPVVPSSATMLTVAASAGPSGTYQMAIHPAPHGTAYLPPTAFRPQPGAFLPVPHHIYPACVFQLPIPHTYYPITHLASSATSPPASSMDNNPNIAGEIPPDCEYYVTTTPQPHQQAMLHPDRQDLHRDVVVTNVSTYDLEELNACHFLSFLNMYR